MTNLGTEYRMDVLNEPSTQIYDIAFSLSEREPYSKEYDKLTDKKGIYGNIW